MRVAFAQPVAPHDVAWFPSLVPGYLAAWLRREVGGVDFVRAAAPAECEGADIVAIGATSQDYDRAREFARAVRAANPGALVVLGGHHVTFLPETMRRSAVAAFCYHAGVRGGHTTMMFKESATAHEYLDGLDGIEIGGSAHNPFNIAGRCLNVDRYPHPLPDGTETVFKADEARVLALDPPCVGVPLPVDVVAPGDAVPLPDGSQGYVVSSHVLEHFYDPVAALLEWDRLVRAGGYILAIVPKFDALPSDIGRPLSTVEEVARRHTGPRRADAGEDRHWFVWSRPLLLDVVLWCNEHTGTRWEVVRLMETDDKAGNGHLLLVRKNGARAAR
jgi:SAM-dependent methyltransferase